MIFRRILPVALVAVIAVLPVVLPTTEVLLTLALSKGLAVLGVIVLLQAGQVSFGHALFFAVSAYAAAFFGKAFGGGELISMVVIGTVAAVAVGAVVGLFVVRYRHIFFGMLNLAVSMIFFSVLEKFYYLTGGSDGLPVFRPSLLGLDLDRATFEAALFYIALGLCLLAGWGTHRFLSSPIGNMLRTVKSNEVRLEYLGVSPRHTLYVGYLVSALLCGMGGSLTAVTQGIVTPEYAWWVRSGEFVFIAILGGAGTVSGAFVGSLIYETVRTYASVFAGDVWQMVLGFVLLGVILYAPSGVTGFYRRCFASRPSDDETRDDTAKPHRPEVAR